jgi:hypothetical protein
VKKLMILVLAIVMLAGCAGVGKWSTGAQKVVDLICAPTPEQKADAARMLAALDTGQAAAAVFFPAADIIKASAVLTTIKDGGCFLVAELTQAFKVVDAANTGIEVKSMGLLKAKPSAIPEYKALRVLIK